MAALPWPLWRTSVEDALLCPHAITATKEGASVPRLELAALELICADAKTLGLLLMEVHWRADARAWLRWDSAVAQRLPGPWLQALVAVRWGSPTAAPLGGGAGAGVVGLVAAPLMTWRYTKLSLLVAHVEAHLCGHGSVDAFLSAIDDFARLASSQWLKVAGGSKGLLLDQMAQRCCSAAGDGALELEFGAFVGYSTSRLATYGLVVSFEHDPVHARVAQHLLDLAAPPGTAEVWLGRVSDLTPRVAEARGAGCVAMAFLDESGSTFHTDLRRLEATWLQAPTAAAVADNCLRPGAPRLLAAWRDAKVPLKAEAALLSWSMPEFLEEAEGVEDWVAVISAQAGRC